MQTFAFPGTNFLALFGRIQAFILTATLSILDPSGCFALSWTIRRPLTRGLPLAPGLGMRQPIQVMSHPGNEQQSLIG